jgi:DNA-binding NarL/FixJ family response regulator
MFQTAKPSDTRSFTEPLAKAAGKNKGRKPLPDDLSQEVVRLAKERAKKKDIAYKLNIEEATVNRILAVEKEMV